MTTRRNPGPEDGRGWARYVQAHLDSLGWSNSILAARAEIDRSLIGRWLNEGTQPSVESVRAVAIAFDVGVGEALVAAGIIFEDELYEHSSGEEPDIRMISDEKLLVEIRRRMARSHGPRGQQVYTEIEEQTGVDVGETREEPGFSRGGRRSPPTARRSSPSAS